MTTTPGTQPSCPEWHDLKTFFDGEVSSARRAAVAEHLGNCSRCTEEMRIMREIAGGLSQLEGMIEPPADLRRRILARIEERGEAAPSRNWMAFLGGSLGVGRWALAAATVIVVGVTWIRLDPPARLAPGAEATGALTQRTVRTTSEAPTSAKAYVAPGARAAESATAGATAATPPTAAGAALPAPQEVGTAAGSDNPGLNDTDAHPSHRPASRDTDKPGGKVAYTAVLTLQVRSTLETSRKEIEARVREGKGRVERSSPTTANGPPRSLRMTLRVPGERLDDHLRWLSRLGARQSQEIRTEDLTSRWQELTTTVVRYRSEEARLRGLAVGSDDAHAPGERRRQLPSLRSRRAAAEQRLAELNRQIELATIDLTLIEGPGR